MDLDVDPNDLNDLNEDLKNQPSPPPNESSITVAVRVRPFTTNESNNLIKVNPDNIFLGDGALNNEKTQYTPKGIRKIVDVVDEKMLIFDPLETNPINTMHRNVFPSKLLSRMREHRFVFDRLFDTNASQQQVFENTTRPLLDSILDGYNATVFAYGATGCGKTHTILGTSNDPGIIFLTMQDLYMKMDQLQQEKEFDLTLLFLEIYNETIRDLLNPETNSKKLVIREDAQNKVFVTNLSTHKPNSVQEVMEMILLGNKNRTCSPTEANATSSRSHAVLQVNVMQRNKSVELTKEHTFATLSIIDLAGSERASATRNTGARLNEGANINKSLLALGNCINALCDPKKRKHTPYRDSKLTRLLKFSLGGNCKTVMIVCVSPLSRHYDETLNTLKYADRAKMIKTKVIRNQHNLDRHVGSYLKMITRQKAEIEELKAKNDLVVAAAVEKYKEANQKVELSIQEATERIKSSVFNKTQEKWQKYFVLAKRQILLDQKMELETVQSSLLSDNLQPEITALVDQVLGKVSLQILKLEQAYQEPDDVDRILDGTTAHVLQRLQEQPQWSHTHTNHYQVKIHSIRILYDHDILFNKSILHDHLVTELKDYKFSSSCFVDLFRRLFSNNLEDITTVKNNIIEKLEFYVNGDFDAKIAEISSDFMKDKVQETDTMEISPPSQKRQNHSPVRSTPAKNFKKIPPGGTRARNKKVHFTESFMESDMSYDDSIMFKSDVEENSPMQNSILSEINDDDLLLNFDPQLGSPPSQKPTHLSIKKVRPRRTSSLTSKRLDDSKIPLLNKRASKLVMGEEEQLPFKNITSPSQILPFPSNTNTRNIESAGSEKVE